MPWSPDSKKQVFTIALKQAEIFQKEYPQYHIIKTVKGLSNIKGNTRLAQNLDLYVKKPWSLPQQGDEAERLFFCLLCLLSLTPDNTRKLQEIFFS